MAARKKRKKKSRKKSVARKITMPTRRLSKFKGRRKTKRRKPRVTTDVSGSTARGNSRYRGGR